MSEFLTETHAERLPVGSHIAIVNDSFAYMSGVRNTYENTLRELGKMGYSTHMIYPNAEDGVHVVYSSLNPDQPIATNPFPVVAKKLDELHPDAIHIAAPQGPMGLTAMLYCHARRLPYTLAFHTHFAKYGTDFLKRSTGIVDLPPEIFDPAVRMLYQGATKVLVPTESVRRELERAGISKGIVWPRGVNTEVFHPREPGEENVFQTYDWYREDPKSVCLYAGRVSPEKNLHVLGDTPESVHMVVIGTGPQEKELRETYPHVHFLGAMSQEQLAKHYKGANVFVFPSLTETFGNVVTEAQACGLPVIAYDAPGPRDIIVHGKTGILLSQGEVWAEHIQEAMELSRGDCAEMIQQRFTWARSAEIFRSNLAPLPKDRGFHPHLFAATQIIDKLF